MKLFINMEALISIQREIDLSNNFETGGILLGSLLRSEDVLVTHAIGPGPNAKKSPVTFQKDYNFSIKMLNYMFKKYSIDFLGEWHTHPNNSVDYSNKDRIAMFDVTKYNVRPCFFIIFGHNFQVNVLNNFKVYSIIGNKKISENNYEIVDNPEELAEIKGLL